MDEQKALEARKKLRKQMEIVKCSKCKSSLVALDMEFDGSKCSCECEQCGKKWEIKLEVN